MHVFHRGRLWGFRRRWRFSPLLTPPLTFVLKWKCTLMWISHFESKCVQNTGFMSRLKRIWWGGGDGGRPLPSGSTCVAWRDGEHTGPVVTCSLKQLKMWSLMLTHAAPICSYTLLITSLKARRGAAATNLIIYLLFWLLCLFSRIFFK